MDEDLFFKKIEEEYKEDIVWNYENASKVINTIPLIYSKYLGYWYKIKSQSEKHQKEYDDTWISRFIFYKKDFDINLSNAEIKHFLDKDTVLNDIKSKQQKALTRCELLEKMMKNIDSIRWDIKLWLQYEQFKTGSI